MILKEKDIQLIKKGMHPEYIWRPRAIVWKNPRTKVLIGKLR